MERCASVVMITDADSPSGKAFIREFAGSGAGLVLGSPSGGSEIEAELRIVDAAGAKALVANADLTSREEVALLLEQARHQLGPVDVLIHNNDHYIPALTEDCEERDFAAVMEANAKTAFLCAQAVGKQMAELEHGSIVFLTSVHAEKPTGSSFAYSASKGAVKMLAKEAALYLGRFGIRVNTIEMGPVEGDPDRFRSPFSTLYDNYRYKVPSGELGSYRDAAAIARFLVSEEARYLNGADIRLDGGFLLHYMDHKMKRPRSGDGT
ncbi:SDR family NAD(P)-dependent oxidoreductase [Paenibacillus thailandensis]|uniref:SDR family NAD(P)-dependent oxidoreductase n=1 Tax=Paenibacillus thailandensis TaxID=393250 RepID=A0ABW5QTN9_9BACL